MPPLDCDILGGFFGEDEIKTRQYCWREGIHYCEPCNPYPGKGRCYHPLAGDIHDSQEPGWHAGDTVRYRCPACGTEWRAELPQ